MEVKVDIEKLQLLNDRISQTIDALNQVRASTRGLSHTSAVDPWSVQGVYPQTVFGSPQVAISAGQPLTFGPVPLQGMQHSNPYVPIPAFTPFAAVPQNPGLIMQQLGGGLSHTNPSIIEQQLLAARMQDPRVLAQTFPFVVAPGATRYGW